MAIYYPKCVHEQPIYRPYVSPGQTFASVSEKASKEVISLPMHPFLTEEEQTKVASVVRAFVERD